MHAPQTPCSQPTCVPVSPSSWRRKSASSSRELSYLPFVRRAIHRHANPPHPAPRFSHRDSSPSARLQRQREHARAQHFRQVTPKRSRGMQIIVRIDRLGSRRRRLREQRLRRRLARKHCLGAARPHRPPANSEEHEPRLAEPALRIARHPRHRPREREIPIPSAELDHRVPRARRPRRQPDLAKHLVRRQRRREMGDEERLRRNNPRRPRCAPHLQLHLQERRQRRPLRRRVRMRKAPAHRPAIPDRAMRNERNRLPRPAAASYSPASSSSALSRVSAPSASPPASPRR